VCGAADRHQQPDQSGAERLESGGTPTSRNRSANHCNPCKHKHYGYADVGGSQEDTCGDTFDQSAATSKMIRNEDALAVAWHEGVDDAKHKGS
jgi:hypothetical protein